MLLGSWKSWETKTVFLIVVYKWSVMYMKDGLLFSLDLVPLKIVVAEVRKRKDRSQNP